MADPAVLSGGGCPACAGLGWVAVGAGPGDFDEPECPCVIRDRIGRERAAQEMSSTSSVDYAGLGPAPLRPGGPSAKSFHRAGASSTHQRNTSEPIPMVEPIPMRWVAS